MKPINNFILAVGLAVALSVTPNNVQTRVEGSQEKAKNYFLQTPKMKQNMERQNKEAFQRNKVYTTDIQQPIKNKDTV